MDIAVNNMADIAVALGEVNTRQEAQATLLKQALDTQASQITQLVDSVPKLADSGSVGTKLHEIA
jgi:hypothetical protein